MSEIANITLAKSYPYSKATEELARIAETIFPGATSTTSYSWGHYEKDGIKIDILTKTSGSVFLSKEFYVTGVKLRFDGLDYKTIWRRIPVSKDGNLDLFRVREKFKELQALKKEVDQARSEAKKDEAIAKAELESLQRQVSFTTDELHSNELKWSISDRSKGYSLNLRNLTFDQILAVGQALGRLK